MRGSAAELHTRASRHPEGTVGSPKLHVARSGAVAAVKGEADRYAANVLPIIREARKAAQPP